MAGSEVTGFAAARADLFHSAAWAIVHSEDSRDVQSSEARLREMILRITARPIRLSVAEHDRIVAHVSHLPHVLSFAFSGTVNRLPNALVAQQMSAGSYRDMMRVSSADPKLWSDILYSNREFLVVALAEYERQLGGLRDALTRDREAVQRAIERTQASDT